MTIQLDKLTLAHEAACATYSLAEKRHVEFAMARFEANDGCPTCRGRGWVVTWDTLDSMTGCYHESGPCPRSPGAEKLEDKWWEENHSAFAGTCTPATRAASGLAPGNSKYDSFHSGSTWRRTETQQDELNTLATARNVAKGALDKENARWTVAKGKLVQVTGQRSRGRNRLPKGMIGVLHGLPNTRWGQKAILIDSHGEKRWTNPYDLTVIDPEPTDEKLALLGLAPDLGFPCLGVFLRVSRSGRAIQVTNPVTGTDEWLPASQINKVQVRRGGQSVDITTDDVKKGKVKRGEGVIVFLPNWVAQEKKFGSAVNS